MQPTYLSKSITAGSSNGVATMSSGTASVAANSSFTIDTQRRIAISSTAGTNLGAVTFTITGTREGGGTVIESLLGSTGTNSVVTTQDFLTVKSITASSVVGAPVNFGTSSQAGSPWKLTNWHTVPVALGAGITFTSSANSMAASIDFTFDDPTGVYPNPFSGNGGSTAASNIGVPTVFTSSVITGVSTNFFGFFNVTANNPLPIAAYRLTITSSSSTAGTVFATVLQAGIAQ